MKSRYRQVSLYIFVAIIGYDVSVHNKVGPEPELNK